MRPRSALLLIAISTAACKEEGVTRARVPKGDQAVVAPMMPPAQERKGISWTLPSGWKELPGTGMRLATFVPPHGLKTEGTVVVLPGDTSGELANANRWRGQLGLPPVDEAGLASSRTSLSTKLGPVLVYDFTSAGTASTRLIAAVVKSGGTTWYFKLMGDAPATEAARAGFTALLQGLRADAAK